MTPTPGGEFELNIEDEKAPLEVVKELMHLRLDKKEVAVSSAVVLFTKLLGADLETAVMTSAGINALATMFLGGVNKETGEALTGHEKVVQFVQGVGINLLVFLMVDPELGKAVLSGLEWGGEKAVQAVQDLWDAAKSSYHYISEQVSAGVREASQQGAAVAGEATQKGTILAERAESLGGIAATAGELAAKEAMEHGTLVLDEMGEGVAGTAKEAWVHKMAIIKVVVAALVGKVLEIDKMVGKVVSHTGEAEEAEKKVRSEDVRIAVSEIMDDIFSKLQPVLGGLNVNIIDGVGALAGAIVQGEKRIDIPQILTMKVGYQAWNDEVTSSIPEIKKLLLELHALQKQKAGQPAQAEAIKAQVTEWSQNKKEVKALQIDDLRQVFDLNMGIYLEYKLQEAGPTMPFEAVLASIKTELFDFDSSKLTDPSFDGTTGLPVDKARYSLAKLISLGTFPNDEIRDKQRMVEFNRSAMRAKDMINRRQARYDMTTTMDSLIEDMQEIFREVNEADFHDFVASIKSWCIPGGADFAKPAEEFALTEGEEGLDTETITKVNGLLIPFISTMREYATKAQTYGLQPAQIVDKWLQTKIAELPARLSPAA